jgi:hypothetical protein
VARNRAGIDAFHTAAAAIKSGGIDNGLPRTYATPPQGTHRATMPPSSSIRTATIWRRSSAQSEPMADVLARRPLLGEALSFHVVHQRRMIKT